MKIENIPIDELKKYLSNKIQTMLLDLDQTTDSDKFNHLLERVSDMLLRNYSFMNINEIDSCLDCGMANGFGNFRKLTVQTITEWFDKRRKEFYEKKIAQETQQKYDNSVINYFASDRLGKVVFKLFNLRRLGILTDEVEKNLCNKYNKHIVYIANENDIEKLISEQTI